MTHVKSHHLPEADKKPSDLLQKLVGLWGVSGVCALLSWAIYRLFSYVAEAYTQHSWETHHWVFLAVWVPFMLYSEGYRGFQKKFSPRVAARARYLARHKKNIGISLLAPPYCMCFFGSSKIRMRTSWILTFIIVCFILLIRLLDQPWRGLIDLGVVMGLTWGVTSILYYAGWSLIHDAYPCDPETKHDS